MEKAFPVFEKIISFTLLILSALFIVFQTVELIWISFEHINQRFTTSLGFGFAPEYAREIMVLFFNILLMTEIMHTIKTFNKTLNLKLRIILVVCLIAVSRKVFILDIEHDAMLEFSTAALILAIAIGYYLVTRSEVLHKLNHDEDTTSEP